MDNDKVHPYYLGRGKELIDGLIELGVINAEFHDSQRYDLIVEYVAMELQDTADSVARWRELRLKADAIMEKRQKQDSGATWVIEPHNGQSSCPNSPSPCFCTGACMGLKQDTKVYSATATLRGTMTNEQEYDVCLAPNCECATKPFAQRPHRGCLYRVHSKVTSE